MEDKKGNKDKKGREERKKRKVRKRKREIGVNNRGNNPHFVFPVSSKKISKEL